MTRKKRRRSWGSITSVTRNRHIVRWVENTPSGRIRRSKTIDGTYRQADRFLAEKRIEVEQPPVMTVGELWSEYERPLMSDRLNSGDMAPKTVRQYDTAWNKHVCPKWGKTPCTCVRPLDIQRWLLSMSSSTGKICRVVLKNTLEHAVMYELLDSNPASKKFRFSEREKKESRVYTQDQLDKLWGVVQGSVCEVPFLLCAHAGMRVGEACGMPIDRVRPVEGGIVLDVLSQLSEDGDPRAKLKTESSRRTVALSDPWADRVQTLIAELPKQAVYVNDNGFGEPVPRWSVLSKWQDLVRNSDVPYMPMQALRPSFETILHWQAGVPVEQVSRIMGHRQVSTTLAHYDRPCGDELVSVALNAAARLREIS